MTVEVKPCPMCGSTNLGISDHGVDCRKCGLWYGAGGCSLERWRKFRGNSMKPVEPGWIIESWNIREGEC